MLFGGTAFAWFTVVTDFIRFYENQGTLFQFSHTITPHPFLTPCFYGAVGFLGAYVYSLYIYFAKEQIQKKHQKYLMIFLIVGTAFAWGNFSLEFCKFYFIKGPKTSCSGYLVSSPFVTPCFYGAMIYLISLINAVLIYKKLKGTNNN